jgi:HAD superfamily hydrolase (TIGR01509 family)
MPLEALIFDVDGTLAETEEVHRRAFNEAFVGFGLDWFWPIDLYRELLHVTGGKERIRHYVEAYKPGQGAKALAQIGDIHRQKNALYAEFVDRGAAKLRPGVVRLIEEARRRGLRLAIATTTSPGNVDALLKASFGAGSASWFEVIGAGDCVAAKKPAPDIYHFVLDRLGIAASACLAFEDSENGVVAARDAGIAVVATPSFYSSGDNFAAASVVLNDLDHSDDRPVDVDILRRLLEGASARLS